MHTLIVQCGWFLHLISVTTFVDSNMGESGGCKWSYILTLRVVSAYCTGCICINNQLYLLLCCNMYSKYSVHVTSYIQVHCCGVQLRKHEALLSVTVCVNMTGHSARLKGKSTSIFKQVFSLSKLKSVTIVSQRAPTLKRALIPYFSPTFLYRVKVFNLMSAHFGVSFVWLMEHTCGVLKSTASSTVHIWDEKLCVAFYWRLLHGGTDRLM